MNHFCTYCDQGYAARMLCLHASLKAQGEPFRLLVLCFDAVTEAVVRAEGDASLVAMPLAELLAADPAYAAVQTLRSRVEFFFTSTPVLVRYGFEREPAAEWMTYLDADLFFFGPPSSVFVEQGDASVGIVPHRFPPHLADRAIHGTYNVGWVSFRRDADGLACLSWWRERCLEWCHDRVEAGRFADQGYLDEFPKKFRGVRALENPGINTAPWNVDGVALGSVGGKPALGTVPVIFYHYQGIREVSPGWFDPGLRTYRQELTRELRDFIYLPYLRQLTATQARLRREHGIEPQRGYQRVPKTGGGWSGAWERFRAKGIVAVYRRLRGRLLFCPEPVETAATR
jgi:hypothetical protein